MSKSSSGNGQGSFVDDRPDEQYFSVHSDAFHDERLLELEFDHVFSKTWAFLGVASQIPKAHDYITTYIGRTPILVTRAADDQVRAFLNICRHKGSILARMSSGNRRVHVCPYHSWSYDSTGKNILVKDKEKGAYPESFERQDHDLLAIAKIASYKGLIFGSLSADVPDLETYLGETRHIIDLAMDQGPDGMEIIPGYIAYTYAGNWKLQLDNGHDQYHLTSTHPSLMAVVNNRKAKGKGNLQAKQFDWNKRIHQTGGMFTFAHGHIVSWLNQAEPENRPAYRYIDEIANRLGKEKAEWVLKMRNLTVFPNMQIADSTSLLIRTFRPLAPDLTEMRVWCLAPIGEPAETREWRIRQFEDFFNVSGMATPDDTTVYELLQQAFRSGQPGWLQGYRRGETVFVDGASESARTLGMSPVSSLEESFTVQNEVVLHTPHRELQRLIKRGLSHLPPY
ncbi:MAG: SRPBCC family protein [Pigmentiphaga sp.]